MAWPVHPILPPVHPFRACCTACTALFHEFLAVKTQIQQAPRLSVSVGADLAPLPVGGARPLQIAVANLSQSCGGRALGCGALGSARLEQCPPPPGCRTAATAPSCWGSLVAFAAHSARIRDAGGISVSTGGVSVSTRNGAVCCAMSLTHPLARRPATRRSAFLPRHLSPPWHASWTSSPSSF